MRVLIIDDEPNVRAGLKIIIPWKDYGFEVCGEGIDGIDGLEKIISLQPDLVLVDIRMPGMMGIAVIAEAKKRGFSGQFIITTGYSEFEYAKKAMSLGVHSYILKPIDEEELTNEIQKLSQLIEEQKHVKEQLNVGEKYISKTLLRELLLGNKVSLEESTMYLAQLEEKYRTYSVAILETSTNLDQLMNILREQLGNHQALEFIEMNNHIVTLIAELEQVVAVKLLQGIGEKLYRCYKIVVTFVMTNKAECLSNICEVYKIAEELLEKKFLYPKQVILEEQFIRKLISFTEETGKNLDSNAMSKRLYALVQVGDKSKVIEVLEEFKEELRQYDIEKEKVISICINILLQTVQLTYERYSIRLEEALRGEVAIEQIYKCISIDEVVVYIQEELFKLGDQIESKAPENTMDKILYYIQNNYNKELRLELLADLFNYNSAYLGKSFKNYTGMSFNMYIDKLRISKAQELLLNYDMKVYEISKKVGYKHIDYFHSKFKKYVGISPLEYRKSKGGIENEREISIN